MAASLDSKKEVFVVHVAFFSIKMIVHPTQKAWIVLLITKKVAILEEYSDFINVFLKKLAIKLFNRFNISKHIINPKSSKQLPYEQIYSLKLIKLTIFKTYIKVNLSNKFIWPSKFLAGAFILFVQKCNGNFYLYIKYCGLNTLIIKN